MTDPIEKAAEEYANTISETCQETDNWIRQKNAFVAGAQWSRTETIKEVLGLLRSEEASEVSLWWIEGMDQHQLASNPLLAREWAGYLADKLGVKE